MEIKPECKLCWFTVYYKKCEDFDKEGCINGNTEEVKHDE